MEEPSAASVLHGARSAMGQSGGSGLTKISVA